MMKIFSYACFFTAGLALAATALGETNNPAVPCGVPSWEELANATYHGVGDGPVTLANGQWRGEPFVEGGSSAPSAGLVADFVLHGDVDGNGKEDAVVLLWSGSGGSGSFSYLAVMSRDSDGEVVNLGTQDLGDRVKVISAEIDGGQIILNVVQAGPSDAACCPGQKLRRTFALDGDTMKEFSSEDLGRLSIADLDGEWELTHFSMEEEVPETLEITLAFDAGRISGKAACNRFNGGVSEGETPGAIRVEGPMAMTRMMCPPPQMEAEQRYMRALENMTRFTFEAGKLVLSWSGEAGSGTLLFKAATG